MTDEEYLPKDKRIDRANALCFALRLFELNRHNISFVNPKEFRKNISEEAFGIAAFLECEMDTSDRIQAFDIALRIVETYNRKFSNNLQELDREALDDLATRVLDFMRHEGRIIS